ncbi:MAG: hypothetical protein JXP34_29165 [Planctomycetes bacterium]|nr:hypothetical protein [Planctomycetota bacterium]
MTRMTEMRIRVAFAIVSMAPLIGAAPAGPYARWKNGPGGESSYFPIAVWLQAPRNAPRYEAIGINLYVGLWQGPTEAQLAELEKHGMPVICDQNRFALSNLDRKIIVGWMHGDEPDNAQALPGGKGYGPPIDPARIVKDYERIAAKDPTRPVILNLGQGVAWDRWHGRGVRTNHPEDYPPYVKGCDIASFDIYPAVHSHPQVAGNLWYVARGVSRLRGWSGDRPVWSCIECTRIGNPDRKPAPREVKAEVWMAIIHGAKGLIYFSHQFKPNFIEAGLLADDEMAKAVGAINRQVSDLAPAINGTSHPDLLEVTSDPSEVSAELRAAMDAKPIAYTLKRTGKTTYVFAVRMEDAPAKATFTVKGLGGKAKATVLGEDRTIDVAGGRFEDAFAPYAVHLYEIE